MSASQDYYAILQVEPIADLDTIKRAYRKKIRRYHPDQYVAELTKVKQSGNTSDVQKIEKRIDHAKQMTQRINAAYAVLSDTADRAAYDQYLSDERQRHYNEEIRQQRMQHWEGERRTIKSRPHHQNPNMRRRANGEGFPWVLLLILMFGVFLLSSLLTNAITQNDPFNTTFVPSNPTSEGVMLASELQSTTNSQQATRIARSTIVFEPTPTPRSSAANETLGDQFMNFGHPERAIDAYTEALTADENNANLYVKRAVAFSALYDNGESDAIEKAILDYSQAIDLDSGLADAYLGRGLLYYELWIVHDTHADAVRSDLEQYLILANPVDRQLIQAILDELP